MRRRGLRGNVGRWTRSASLLLLVLFAHGFVVSATHGHRFARAAAAGAEQGIGVGGREDAGRPSEAGADAQCVLCRLQRNFVTDFHTVSTLVGAPPSSCQPFCLPPAPSAASRAYSVPQGRAPPLA